MSEISLFYLCIHFNSTYSIANIMTTYVDLYNNHSTQYPIK